MTMTCGRQSELCVQSSEVQQGGAGQHQAQHHALHGLLSPLNKQILKDFPLATRNLIAAFTTGNK